jgi:hypothetical protein
MPAREEAMVRRPFHAALVGALALLPTFAAGGEGGGLKAIDVRPFALARDSALAHQAALGRLPGRRVTAAQVLADGNREGRRARLVLGVAPWRLHGAFRWNEGDEETSEWYPQGITGLRVDGKAAVLVAWYHKRTKGVRISFADVTDLSRVRYRHALLVEPTIVNGQATVKAVQVHAGGCALVGRWLYVVDTSRGFRTFDLERMLEASTDRDDTIGVSGGRLRAYGYKYVIPQVGGYTVSNSAPLRFSSVSIDRSTTPPSLVTCEYHKDDIQGRVFRWTFDERTGELLTRGGLVRPVEAFVTQQTKVQGVTAWRGTWYLSCSSQNARFGALYAARPGRPSEERSWCTGAESLHFSPTSGNLWSLSEHPGERVVFFVKRADYD